MHQGCFVWTPTPPLSGPWMPRPGPARVCVCVLCLAGSGGPASRARSGAPHLFMWPLCPSSLFGPLRAWVALFAVVFFFLHLCAPVVSGVACFPARGALGLGVLFAPPSFLSFSFFPFSRPLLVFFFLLLCVLFVAFFLVYFFPLLCLLLFFFPALFVVFFFFLVQVVRCGVGLCVCGCGVCWCVVLLALWSVVRCVFCLVLCGVLVLGWVLRPCCPPPFALGLVGLFLLFSAVVCCCVFCWFFFFAFFRAFPWWSVFFWSVWCSAVVRLAV